MLAEIRKIKFGIAIAALLLSVEPIFAVGAPGGRELGHLGLSGPESVATTTIDSMEPVVLPTPRTRRSTLSMVDMDRFVQRLESDRRLLSEIRKEVPDARLEAEMYLKRLKELAARSDPVRLVPLVNRVLEQAPTYLDWVDRDFENEEERAMEYYVGGARGFNFALESFKSAVMMTVINRLDIAARVIKELDTDSIQ